MCWNLWVLLNDLLAVDPPLNLYIIQNKAGLIPLFITPEVARRVVSRCSYSKYLESKLRSKRTTWRGIIIIFYLSKYLLLMIRPFGEYVFDTCYVYWDVVKTKWRRYYKSYHRFMVPFLHDCALNVAIKGLWVYPTCEDCNCSFDEVLM